MRKFINEGASSADGSRMPLYVHLVPPSASGPIWRGRPPHHKQRWSGGRRRFRCAGGRRPAQDHALLMPFFFSARTCRFGHDGQNGRKELLRFEIPARSAIVSFRISIPPCRPFSFTRPLFMLAVWTGLREGDICTLKWEHVFLDSRIIARRTRKTGVRVQIPISDQLFEFLSSVKKTDSEYVFPKHAEMYLTNPDGVSYRIKKFLDGLGIETTRTPEGRTRAISIKDLHSCRHTFCYYAGLAGIPLTVVQALVGHMSPAMTAHYSEHATMEDKRRGMERLSFFKPEALPAAVEEPERNELRSMINTLPIELIRKMLELGKKGGRKK